MIDVLWVREELDPGELRGLARLAARLATRGVSARLLCLGASLPLPEGLEVIECPGLASPWRRDWLVRRLPLGAESRPDLLHVEGAELAAAGLAVAEHWGVPYLVSIDEFPPPEARLRFSRRWARGVVVSGADLAEELRQQFGVPTEWIEVIPPGLELPTLSPPETRADRVPVIGTSAMLTPGGGLPHFLDAARRLSRSGREIEFVVDGQGRDEPALRRLAARMGVLHRVTFADGLGVGPAFWTVLDVYCQVSRVPNAGHVLAEALAHGVPTIASDVLGLRGWILPGQTGIVIPPDDAEALAGAIRELLDDPARAVALGHAARAWIARHHDPGAQADALLAAYRRALEPPERPGVLAMRGGSRVLPSG